MHRKMEENKEKKYQAATYIQEDRDPRLVRKIRIQSKIVMSLIGISIVAILSCFNLMACKVDSKYEAELKIRTLVTTDIKFIKSEGDKICKTYTFEDENGIGFKYESVKGRDGEGIPGIWNSCNYASELVNYHKSKIIQLCNNYNLEYKWDTLFETRIIICIQDYHDINNVSKLIYDILNEVGELPFKKDVDYLYSQGYDTPEIQIEKKYNNTNEDNLFLLNKNFLYSKELRLTPAQIEKELMTQYIIKVTQYDKTETIPDDIKEKYSK